MFKTQREFFSSSGMTVIGLLLAGTIACAVYSLWDIAIRRWFD